jgi:hypothetical protein
VGKTSNDKAVNEYSVSVLSPGKEETDTHPYQEKQIKNATQETKR